MKSFFRKISSDAVTVNERKKKFKFKTKQGPTESTNEGLPSKGNNFWIENCQNFHFGNTYNLSTTSIITTEAGGTGKEDTPSPQAIPQKIKDNFANISEATIDHFDLISTRIKNYRNLEKELGLGEEGFNNLPEGEQDEFGVCELLFRWKKAKMREATLGLLLRILWEAKEYDAATFLAENL